MTENYRHSLIYSIKELIKTRDVVFECAFRVAMNNQLEEFNDVFEVGDEYQFNIEHFEDSNDINLKLIVNLLKEVELTVNKLENINNVNLDEE
jgi:hypothetical protein